METWLLWGEKKKSLRFHLVFSSFPRKRRRCEGFDPSRDGLLAAPACGCPQGGGFLPRLSLPPRACPGVLCGAKHRGIPEHLSLPGAESLGAGSTQAAAAAWGWRAAPALAPTRQMASLSPCDFILFFFLNFWLLFQSAAPSPSLPPAMSPCNLLPGGEERAAVVSTRFLHEGARFSVPPCSPWWLPCGTWKAGSPTWDSTGWCTGGPASPGASHGPDTAAG